MSIKREKITDRQGPEIEQLFAPKKIHKYDLLLASEQLAGDESYFFLCVKHIF